MNDTTEPPVLAATNTTEIQPVSSGRSAFPGAPARPSASVAAIAASTAKAPAPSSDPDRGVVIASLNDQPMATQGAGDLREATVEDIRSGNIGSERERDEKDINILSRMPDHSEVPEPSAAVPPGEAGSMLPTIDQRTEAVATRVEAAEEPSWESPDESLLADIGIPEPTVPMLFSDGLHGEIRDVAQSLNAPIAFLFAGLLAVLAAILGNKARFWAGPAWREVSVLWLMLVGPSGVRKSSTARAYLQFLHEFEAAEAVNWEERLQAVDRHNLIVKAEHRLYEARLNEAVRTGGPLPDAPDRKPIVLPRRTPPKIIVDDFSPPALIDAHAQSRTGLLLVSDEVASLLHRIDTNGGVMERTLLLRAHDGGFYRVDRVSRDVPEIESLAVSILGGIPTERLDQLLGPVPDGFAARCLWAACDDSEMVTIALEAAQTGLAGKVLPTLRALVRAAREPIDLPLAQDGIALLQEATRRWHRTAAEAHGQIQSWLMRAPGQALRLAGLRELCEWALTGEDQRPMTISATSIEAAIEAVDSFFAPMAQRILGSVGTAKASRDAGELARVIARQGGTIINRRGLGRQMRGRLADSTTFHAAFDALETGGWLRRKPRPDGALGRPSTDYEVNPLLL
jgi:hypothetical protein